MTAEEQPRRSTAWRARLLATVMCVVVGLFGGLLAAASRSEDEPPVRFFPPAEPRSDFQLRDQDGDLVSLQSRRGRVVALTFLYATCWDLCPAQAEIMRDALERVDGRDVEALIVSVDAVGDTPPRARTFVEKHLDFGGPVHYLLGSRPQLAAVWRRYGIAPIDASPQEAEASAVSSEKYWAMQEKSGQPPEDEAAVFEYPKRPAPDEASDPYPAADDLSYRGRTRHAHGAAYEHSAYVLLIDKHGRQRVGFPFEQLSERELARDLRALVAER